MIAMQYRLVSILLLEISTIVYYGREEIRTPKGLSPAQLATETASP